MGHYNRWSKLTRDLIIDIQKGITVQGKPKRKIPKSKLKASIISKADISSAFIYSINVMNNEEIKNVILLN